jgi:hypothetical protein
MTRLFGKTLLSLLLLIATTTMLWAEEVTGVSVPPKGKAQIVFMRPVMFGGAIKSAVFDVTSDENKVIGAMRGKKKFVHIVDPGEYTFMVIGRNADFMKAKVEAGKTYYVLVQVRMGMWKARFTLVPIRKAELDGEEFKKWNRKARLIEMNQGELDVWAEKHMKDIQAKREKFFVVWNKKTDAAKKRYMMHADDGR